jgi:hypothetical protein
MRLPTVGGTGRASFKLFSVALLIHDGTLLTMKRWNRSTTETTCRQNIFAGFPTELLTSGATSERTRNLRTAGIRKLRQRIHETLETVCDSRANAHLRPQVDCLLAY